MESQIKEADIKFKEGKEKITKSLFRWSKDYTSGVMFFDDAVKLQKASKQWNKAIEALKNCIICNEQLNDHWAVARNLESIIAIILENMDKSKVNPNELNGQLQQAVVAFKMADSNNNAVKLYQKVAKFYIKNGQADLAQELLKSNVDECEQEDNGIYNKTDIYSNFMELLVDMERYSEAADLKLKEIKREKANTTKYPLNQWSLTVVVLYLIQNEPVRAEEELQNLLGEVQGFLGSLEYQACSKLLDAYNEGNQQAFNEQVARAIVTQIQPVNIVRQLKKVKVRNVGPAIKNQEGGDYHEQGIVAQDDEEKKKALEKLLF